MKFPHTPAPWSVEIDHSSNAPEFIRTYVDGEMYDLASVLCDETGNATANARLIAAAPELLAALQAIVHRIDPQGDEAPESARCRVCGEHPGSHAADCPVTIARAAITKATGENA